MHAVNVQYVYIIVSCRAISLLRTHKHKEDKGFPQVKVWQHPQASLATHKELDCRADCQVRQNSKQESVKINRIESSVT